MSSTDIPKKDKKKLEDSVIEQILGMKELFAASFNLKGKKVGVEEGSLSSEGTELSLWAKKPENKKYQETIARFSNGIKDIFLDEDMIEQLHAFEELQPPLKSIEDKSPKNVEDNENYNKILMKYPIFKGKFSDIKKEYKKLKTKKERTEFLHAFEELQTLKSIEDKSPKGVEDNEDFNKILETYPIFKPIFSTIQGNYNQLKTKNERIEMLREIIKYAKNKNSHLTVLQSHYLLASEHLKGRVEERKAEAEILAKNALKSLPYKNFINLLNDALQQRINLYAEKWDKAQIPSKEENLVHVRKTIINPMDSFIFSVKELLKRPEEMEFGGRLTMKIFLSTHPELTKYLYLNLSFLKDAHVKYLEDLEKQRIVLKNQELPQEVHVINQKIAFLDKISETKLALQKNYEDDPINQENPKETIEELERRYTIMLKIVLKNELDWLKKNGFWDSSDQKNIESLLQAKKSEEYQTTISYRFYIVCQILKAEQNEKVRQRVESIHSEIEALHHKIESKIRKNLPIDELQKNLDEIVLEYNNLNNQYIQRQVDWIKDIGYWTDDLQKAYVATQRTPEKWEQFKTFLDEFYMGNKHLVENELQHLKPHHRKPKVVEETKELEVDPSKQIIFREKAKPSNTTPQKPLHPTPHRKHL